MENPKYNATVKKTGKQIVVYKRTLGGWVDYEDCKTIYSENEILVDKSKEV